MKVGPVAACGPNNLQAEIDWGFRATHVTALAGKAIAFPSTRISQPNLMT
jgi:hypothetical protein